MRTVRITEASPVILAIMEKENELKRLRDAVLKLAKIVKMRSRSVRVKCDEKWRRKLYKISEEKVVKEFEKLLRVLKNREIARLHRDGFFTTEKLITVAGQCVLKKGMATLGILQPLMMQYYQTNGE